MKIYFEEGQAVSQEIRKVMETAAERCVTAEGIEAGRTEISVTFVTEEEIKELNSTYRGKDSVTDVLSFPQFDRPDLVPCEGEIILGDVVICRKRAEEQAVEFGHSFEREIIYLFVHSVLHLLGYDHIEDRDKKLMRTQEEKIMEYLKIGRQ